MGILARLACVAVLAAALAGCASDPMTYSQMPAPNSRGAMEASREGPQQCAPYARAHSRIKIFGDAYTWWDQASGHYPRGTAPTPGSVMVLYNYAGPTHGHVAVVRTVVSTREIRVDHANWLDDGSVFVNDPVLDVSAENDWSAVRVFNVKTGAWGGRVYPVQGFIGSGKNGDDDDDKPDLVADAGGGMGPVSLLPRE